MKKIFIAVLALAAVAACNKSEIVSVSEGNAIAFDNAFVDNATKSVNDPSFTNEEGKMFNDFAVYGYVEGAELFAGVKVSKTIDNEDLDQDWKYSGTQYWIAGAKYNFAAVAPFTGNWEKTAASKDGVSLSFKNNGTTDLLYAQTSEIEGKVSENTAVEFTFRHILSKVKFSFENAYNATNATIIVRNITITNAYKTANAALNASETTWKDQAGELALAFGNAAVASVDAEEAFAFGTTVESYNELLLIPGAVTDGYNVTFIVDLIIGDTLVKSYEHTATVDFTPVAGTCYAINAEINAANIDPKNEQEPIEFTVAALPSWGNPGDVDATIN